jgi:hypothetical protein
MMAPTPVSPDRLGAIAEACDAGPKEKRPASLNRARRGGFQSQYQRCGCFSACRNGRRWRVAASVARLVSSFKRRTNSVRDGSAISRL